MGPPNPVKFETLCNDQNDHSADAEVFDKRQTSSPEKEQSHHRKLGSKKVSQILQGATNNCE